MKSLSCDVAVIGSGPAGLAAACAAREQGAAGVLVVERSAELGGILPQCIHNGFGVEIFEEDLTGPEYATRWMRKARDAGVEFLTETMVLEIEASRTLIATNARQGLMRVEAGAIVLAMGCRERPRGALAIPGTRPAGVYTAGTAQRLVNMEGYMPGERFAILGSGDIGMIMARRLTLEGARVVGMFEILPYVSGLRRNLVQCIRDFDIPLHLGTTVTEVRGRQRVESLVVSEVAEDGCPLPQTEREVPCDTLLLSVGLIPENELSRQVGISIDPITGGPYVDEDNATSVEGIYAAGNVVHVYDLVDQVTRSALRAGRRAADYVRRGPQPVRRHIAVTAGDNVRHVVPQYVHPVALEQRPVTLEFRVRTPLECATYARIHADGETLLSQRLRYARPSEMIAVTLKPDLAPKIAKAETLEVSCTPA
ncbi:MAG: FAD-dependent oxidoreductase [Chloroflexota bacterium]|nr:FAD-dependent oxidoreductase [Chloroflexota bacterium]